MLHGSKEDEHRHVGDLGNLIVDVYGMYIHVDRFNYSSIHSINYLFYGM